MLKRIALLLVGAVFFAAVSAAPAPARAQKISLIRDAEVENTIRMYSTPLFQAAGLNAADVRIHLVNDASLNAFVAGGQRLFINTGLILQSKHAGQVIGVIAHETGHIAGGHLARMDDQLRKATAQQIIAMVLGGAAGVASGRGDVAGAMILGGSGAAMGSFLGYSRTQESAADNAAMEFLDRSQQSSKGLLEFMEILAKQELLSAARQDPYVRTHPLSRERVETLRQHVNRSEFSNRPLSPETEYWYRRMHAKLLAFLYPLGHTLRSYPESNTSLEARYARAVAYYRAPQLDKALELIDGLIAETPKDPYFHELKGQMLFENGRGAEALAPYQKAVALLPNSELLRAELGRVQIETQEPELLGPAIDNLRFALRQDRTQPFYWRQLAIAYGRRGDTAQSSLALAEEALLIGRLEEARYHAGKAQQTLPRGSPGWLQAEDILEGVRARKPR